MSFSKFVPRFLLQAGFQIPEKINHDLSKIASMFSLIFRSIFYVFWMQFQFILGWNNVDKSSENDANRTSRQNRRCTKNKKHLIFQILLLCRQGAVARNLYQKSITHPSQNR